jgi:AcrR family transcriptional regulator
MDVVTASAGVNKTTIYRRWPGKKQLVAAAVDSMRRFVHDVPLPATGSLEQDLAEAFRRKGASRTASRGRSGRGCSRRNTTPRRMNLSSRARSLLADRSSAPGRHGTL